MSIKKSLLDHINKIAKRREQLSEEISKRSDNVEEFVVKILDELDGDLVSMVSTDILNDPVLREYYFGGMREQIKTLDNGAVVTIIWAAETSKNDVPRISGILIKWSEQYKVAHNCEPELFVDMTTLLFK